MEAASIPWRPLGRLLVEQGLLTDEELELALAKQQVTGKRLGETIVECGFVSRPELSNALAAQYGIELTAETGFGTGLRAQIQQRHESDRGRAVPMRLVTMPQPAVETDPEPAETAPTPSSEALLLAQLEEQWARLAAAEERLAEREFAFAAVVEEREGRRAQAERLARRARRARAAEADRNEELRNLGMVVDNEVDEQRALLAAAEERLAERERELTSLASDLGRRRDQVVRFVRRVRGRDEELAQRTGELHAVRKSADGLREQVEQLSEDLSRSKAERDRQRAQSERLARRARHARSEQSAVTDEQRATLAEELARRGEELRGLGELTDGLRGQVDRLTDDVRGCDIEIARLRQENVRRRAQAARLAARLLDVRRAPEPVPVVATHASHLVFVQLTDGYSLVEREGPPPPRNTPLELPDLCDETLVVAGLRRSPFPGDARPCVVVERA